MNISRYLTTQTYSKSPLPPPLCTQSTLINNHWIWQQNDHIKFPIIRENKIELPNGIRWIPSLIEPLHEKIIEAPSKEDNNVSKEAARLIIIRRKKMKKHKLRKLRKRMKFEWAKVMY